MHYAHPSKNRWPHGRIAVFQLWLKSFVVPFISIWREGYATERKILVFNRCNFEMIFPAGTWWFLASLLVP
jgi:hypothetical protein